MKIKCKYCGGYISSTEEICPHCGAPNDSLVRVSSDTPKTIEELKDWYEKAGLPSEEVTRFFIGKNIKEPRAFGIYKNKNDEFVVYKNKSDGERNVRYRGKDEAYAVNELYQKLRSERLNQKENNLKHKSSNSSKKVVYDTKDYDKSMKEYHRNKLILLACSLILIPIIMTVTTIALFIAAIKLGDSPTKGYYTYNNRSYYYNMYNSRWYLYDTDTNTWDIQNSSDVDSELTKNYEDYYGAGYYDDYDDSEVTKFEGSDEYNNTMAAWESRSSNDDSTYDNSWDNSDSWDSYDSWDSGTTNWDSDW
jgi:hypothetical protein